MVQSIQKNNIKDKMNIKGILILVVILLAIAVALVYFCKNPSSTQGENKLITNTTKDKLITNTTNYDVQVKSCDGTDMDYNIPVTHDDKYRKIKHITSKLSNNKQQIKYTIIFGETQLQFPPKIHIITNSTRGNVSRHYSDDQGGYAKSNIIELEWLEVETKILSVKYKNKEQRTKKIKYN